MACPQDSALEWFAAAGPTVATLAAVGATIWSTLVARRVSRDAAELQKRMSGPRISVVERTRLTQESWREWNVELTNDGQTVGSIQGFRVLIDGQPVSRQSFEAPRPYWDSVFQALGLGTLGYVEANALAPPVSVAPGSPYLLFAVILTGQPQQIMEGMRRLRIEIEYASLWGESEVVPTQRTS